jgi:hypothetical protein
MGSLSFILEAAPVFPIMRVPFDLLLGSKNRRIDLYRLYLIDNRTKTA